MAAVLDGAAGRTLLLDARIRSVPAAQASDVIRSENFFISCDPNGETLPLVTNFAGGDHILHASDYPHFDGRFPDTVKLTERPEVFPPEVQRKIL